jgi:hypothetical protein
MRKIMRQSQKKKKLFVGEHGYNNNNNLDHFTDIINEILSLITNKVNIEELIQKRTKKTYLS